MNLRFLPFVFGMMVVSSATNAETFDEVITESLSANDTYIYGNMELNNRSGGLKINLPRAAENYSNFIECRNNNIAVYNTMFSVSSSGSIAGTGLCIKESSADHTYSAALGINFNKNDKSFHFSTSSYPGTADELYYPISFSAREFTFDKGDMVVNGNITCKKETVLDSALSVNDNATFHKNINVSGETSLSTLNINIPFTSDKSGQKTRCYDYLIDCSDATTNSYRRMFTVDWNGNVSAKGLTLRAGTAIDTPYSSTLKMYFDKESNSFVFNTSGYEGSPYERHNTLTFDAGNYIFNRGNMIVNGIISCKKEILLDSALSVNDNAAFHKNINVSGETSLSTLNINNPLTSDTSGQKTRSYDYLIKCTDAATDSFGTMFTVDWSGNVNAKGLTLRESTAIDTSNSSTLNMYFDKESNSFVFNTSGNEGGSDESRNSLTFDAGNYIFNKGDMVVNGNIICKNETVFDSVLSVNDNAAFHKNINVSGEASLSTLNINIPCTSDNSGQKTRSYDYLIKCTDAATDSSSTMFTVDWSGNVNAKGLTLREGIAIATPDSSTLNMYFDKESNSFVFNTSGNEDSSDERRNSLTFDADNYTFNKGDMVVNGKLTCRNELNVLSLNADDVNVNMKNVADYVFDENYNLKSLSEVESFVKENKHLPGIPSAAEMEENGVSLAKMSNMLLEKVEELTLHLIRLEKENAELKAKFEALEK
jgi:alkyl hydroperoxide reductase subunit AhpC